MEWLESADGQRATVAVLAEVQSLLIPADATGAVFPRSVAHFIFSLIAAEVDDKVENGVDLGDALASLKSRPMCRTVFSCVDNFFDGNRAGAGNPLLACKISHADQLWNKMKNFLKARRKARSTRQLRGSMAKDGTVEQFSHLVELFIHNGYSLRPPDDVCEERGVLASLEGFVNTNTRKRRTKITKPTVGRRDPTTAGDDNDGSEAVAKEDTHRGGTVVGRKRLAGEAIADGREPRLPHAGVGGVADQ